MKLAFHKSICPQCGKMTLAVWPPVGDEPGRKTCSNPGCNYKEIEKD